MDNPDGKIMPSFENNFKLHSKQKNKLKLGGESFSNFLGILHPAGYTQEKSRGGADRNRSAIILQIIRLSGRYSLLCARRYDCSRAGR